MPRVRCHSDERTSTLGRGLLNVGSEQRGAGDEIDERFRHRLIQSENRDELALGEGELLDSAAASGRGSPWRVP